jgi:N,N'-diacetyllegionaminate synthase
MGTMIIAEAGVNHNGSIEMAKKLVDVAASAGADFIKFQTFKAEKLVGKEVQKADYQKENVIDDDNSQYSMLKKLELSESMHHEIISYCKTAGIKFLSTAFDLDSIDFLDHLQIELFKIPSGEITNKPYLKHIASKQKPVILSTGMANKQEISDALEVLISGGITRKNITVLHCSTEYPTPMENVNLKAMLDIQNEMEVQVGYSDHTLGFEVPIAAVALGAVVIEKHITLDKNLPGPDHKASLEPDELKKMVSAIRNIELAIAGSGKKEPGNDELKNSDVVRKSIVAARKIEKDEVFSSENITVKRPGTGISPMRWDEIIGVKAKRSFNKDEIIEL